MVGLFGFPSMRDKVGMGQARACVLVIVLLCVLFVFCLFVLCRQMSVPVVRHSVGAATVHVNRYPALLLLLAQRPLWDAALSLL